MSNTLKIRNYGSQHEVLVRFLAITISYGVLITSRVLILQYDFGVKCLGQFY